MSSAPVTTPANKSHPLKRIFAALLIAAVSSVALALIFTFLLQDRIKQVLISRINQQVTVPVKVEGGINLSIIRHFPYASVTFSKVSIDDVLRKGDLKLLKAKEISFLCNIYSLFGNEIEFSKILLRNGELNVYVNELGKTNYDILKPQKEISGNKLSVRLQSLSAENIQLGYKDRTQATDISVQLKSASLKGNLTEKVFDLESKAEVYVNRILANGEEYLTGRNINVESILNVERDKQRYNFRKGDVTIDKTGFDITGNFVLLKNATDVDFKLSGRGKDIEEFYSFFPEKYKTGLANASGNGKYNISASVNGVIKKSSLPKVNVKLDLKDGELRLGKYNKLLKNVNASAHYESDERGSDKIVISNFGCTLNDLPFNFKLTLVNLSNPAFDFYANGVLHLSELSSFVPDSVMQEMDGSITFSNFHLQGKKDDFTDVANSGLTGSGQFEVKEVEFRQNGITYGNINGLLKYEDRIIDAQNFTLDFLTSDFCFTGTIENLLPFVYNLSVKRAAGDVVLGANGKAKIHTFNLTGILEAYNKKNRPWVQQREKINVREIFSMKGNMDVEVDKFLFRKMRFSNLKANLQLAPGMVRINQLSTKAMDGDLHSSGLMSFTPDNSLNLKIDVSALQLSVPEIFAECENFGQKTLTDNNLKGTMTAAVNLNATWKNYKELDENSLSAIVDFNITNGQLIKFEPLKAASKFIKVEELENIRFADLQNTIRIANRRLDLPEFEIKSSALNLMLFGSHDFNNNVDYHFKINLHKLLAQKFRRFKTDEQFIESDPYEGVNLYLTMTGNLASPNIKFDKASVRKKVLADFRKEKTVLRDLLHNTTPAANESNQKREDKYFNVKEQPQFMEFDTVRN